MAIWNASQVRTTGVSASIAAALCTAAIASAAEVPAFAAM